ncbi:MAG: hypothetical protein HY900_37010 [Deltaproteobacteria bacterium]|nr:hypothetical protein [Deltaproteobacteria bacterium]
MKRTTRKAAGLGLILLSLAASGLAAERAVPRVSIDFSGHPFKGPADAPVTLVVFSDYL